MYFTSGTQEGSPIDRVLGTLARTFGLERQILPRRGRSGKSFFINRLLQDVIFTEAGWSASTGAGAAAALHHGGRPAAVCGC